MARSEVAVWLRRWLEMAGPLPVTKVYEGAASMGFSRSLIQRARGDIGARVEKLLLPEAAHLGIEVKDGATPWVIFMPEQAGMLGRHG